MKSCALGLTAALLAAAAAGCSTGDSGTGNGDSGRRDSGVLDTGDVDTGVLPDAGLPRMDAGGDGIASGGGGGDAGADGIASGGGGGDAMADGTGDGTGARDGASDGAARDASDACVPTTEVCNGLDDDCNGMVDETGCPGHLLINEIVAFPNDAEFIEVYNPTAGAVDLSNVYLTDWHRYAEAIGATGAPAPGATDFLARFPAGAMVAAHGYVTVATGNPGAWSTNYGGACPTYYLQPTATVGTCTASQLMRPLASLPGSIGMTASLTNAGEPVTLFAWNGTSDLVGDVDYVFYGAPSVGDPVVDKSMTSIDGPDPDTMTTGYRLDTPASSQQQAPVHVLSAASVRCDALEGTEVHVGGNGIFGHNETSENLATTWRVTVPTTTVDGGHVSAYAATPGAANTGCM